MSDYLENPVARLASKYINQTNQHLFLTGKAGTGKTTFLRHVVETTYKNTIVAAPTGIAAINAGGITLHSLFQLPFGTFLPSSTFLSQENTPINTLINTPQSLIKSFQMNRQKRKMLREMELLIIDEVSMLRADILDAIDTVLRFVHRSRNIPFGGVQILFIGDMLQLPPVIREEEKKYMSGFYENGYFFEAKALENNLPLYFELDKIYRQTDATFIKVLNNIRENKLQSNDINLLNKHYIAQFQPKKDDGFIYLTTHNKKAIEKNNIELSKLKGKSYTYDAIVEGEFSEFSYPLEYTLELKVGAQVMFVKNDYSGEQRYFNGKIGTVTGLGEDFVEVDFRDGSLPFLVDKYAWENKKYKLDQDTNEVEEEVVGTFLHYPIKLAWAITIHKSQGLTFDKAIIDVERVFASGQIYVALSRLRSLEGLVLSAPVCSNQIMPDDVLIDFSKKKKNTHELENSFEEAGMLFIRKTVLEAFDFKNTLIDMQTHVQSYTKDEKRSEKQHHKQWAEELAQETKLLQQMADKFLRQLHSICSRKEPEVISHLDERVKAAITYFEPRLKGLSEKVFAHMEMIKLQKGVKKYMTELKALELSFFSQLQRIHKTAIIIKSAIENREMNKKELHQAAFYKEREESMQQHHYISQKITKQKIQKKQPKVPTREISFALYKEGKNISEIAKERGLVNSTIETHLLSYIQAGEIDVCELLSQEKVNIIKKALQKNGTDTLTPVKVALGDDYTYGEIRMVRAGMK